MCAMGGIAGVGALLRPCTYLEELCEMGHQNESLLPAYVMRLKSVRPFTREQIKTALVHLRRQVPCLRLCFTENGGTTWFQESTEDFIDLEMIDHDAVDDILAMVSRYRYRDRGPLWCVKVLTGYPPSHLPMVAPENISRPDTGLGTSSPEGDDKDDLLPRPDTGFGAHPSERARTAVLMPGDVIAGVGPEHEHRCVIYNLGGPDHLVLRRGPAAGEGFAVVVTGDSPPPVLDLDADAVIDELDPGPPDLEEPEEFDVDQPELGELDPDPPAYREQGAGLPAYGERDAGLPAYGEQGAGLPAYEEQGAGLPAYGERRAGLPAYGERGAGLPAYGEQGAGLPAYGERGAGLPAYGERGAGLPAYGERGAGLPAYGEREAGLPAYGERGAGLPAYREQGAGMPAFGERGAGLPAYGEQGAGLPAYGEREAGLPAYGEQGAGLPAYGEQGAGLSAFDERGAGLPAYGEQGAGLPAYGGQGAGLPAYGERGTGLPAFGERGTGSSPYRGRRSGSPPYRRRGSGPPSYRGRGSGPPPYRGRGSGQPPNRGRGSGPPPNRGRGSGPTAYRGRGSGPPAYRGRGSGLPAYRGRGSGPPAYRGRGSGSPPYRGRGAGPPPYRGRGSGPPPCGERGGISPHLVSSGFDVEEAYSSGGSADASARPSPTDENISGLFQEEEIDPFLPEMPRTERASAGEPRFGQGSNPPSSSSSSSSSIPRQRRRHRTGSESGGAQFKALKSEDEIRSKLVQFATKEDQEGAAAATAAATAVAPKDVGSSRSSFIDSTSSSASPLFLDTDATSSVSSSPHQGTRSPSSVGAQVLVGGGFCITNLLIGIHQGIADGVTAFKICGRLVKLLNDIVENVEINDSVPLEENADTEFKGILNPRIMSLSDLEKQQELRAEMEERKNWVSSMTGVFVETPGPGGRRARHRNRHEVLSLDAASTTRLLDRCQSEGVSLIAAFTALANIALMDVLTARDIIMETYRFYSSHGINLRQYYNGVDSSNLMGCLFAPVHLKTPTPRHSADSFWDFVRVFDTDFKATEERDQALREVAMMELNPLSRSDYEQLFKEPLPIMKDFFTCYLEDVTPLVTEGGPHVTVEYVESTMSRHKLGYALCHMLHLFKNSLCITLNYSSRFLTIELAKEYMSNINRRLVEVN